AARRAVAGVEQRVDQRPDTPASLPQPMDELANSLLGISGARRIALAGYRDRPNAGGEQGRVPGALATGWIGRVEHQCVEGVRVAEGIRLGKKGSVGVPVQRDAPEAQGPAHIVDVVGGGGGAVGAEQAAQLPR